jgi:uncharacterized protein (DUF2235 family)
MPEGSGETIVPPSHKNRTLVLCFDGMAFDPANSNVLQFYSMLKKDSSVDQKVYYQTLGTYKEPSITPTYLQVSETLDAKSASHLCHHIMAGYEWLMETCWYNLITNKTRLTFTFSRLDTVGDQICIFGFSRGGYVACALAAMLCKVLPFPTFYIAFTPQTSSIAGWITPGWSTNASSARISPVHAR